MEKIIKYLFKNKQKPSSDGVKNWVDKGPTDVTTSDWQDN